MGEGKKGVLPHLKYWGRVPGLPPRVYASNVASHLPRPLLPLRGLGGVVVIDAAIGAHGRGSRPAHYLTVAATLDKSLTSHCL